MYETIIIAPDEQHAQRGLDDFIQTSGAVVDRREPRSVRYHTGDGVDYRQVDAMTGSAALTALRGRQPHEIIIVGSELMWPLSFADQRRLWTLVGNTPNLDSFSVRR